MLAFLRLATKANVFPRPLAVEGTLDRIDAWLGSPAAVVVEPTANHIPLVRSLLASAGSAGIW